MHNDRFPEQWEIIKGEIDVKGKVVLDLGCGYGDMVGAMIDAGALYVTGVERDANIGQIAVNNTDRDFIFYSPIENRSIEEFTSRYSGSHWNIIVCFSVLPYIQDQGGLLEWIAGHCETALLEIQLKGDGPGIIESHDQLQAVLEIYFNEVEPIGKTLVPYRNMYRTIWKCGGRNGR